MMDSIGSSSPSFRPPPPPQNAGSNSLDSDQSALIEETLASYDAENLTEQDAASIVNTFADAGINPSAQFADLLAESGFDAKQIGSMAGVAEGGPSSGQRPPPPPSGGNGDMDLSSIVEYLDGLSSNEETGTTSSLAASLAEKFGLSEGQSLINVMA